MFKAALLTKAKKQSKGPSVDEWINKVWYVSKWNISHKKEHGINVNYNVNVP